MAKERYDITSYALGSTDLPAILDQMPGGIVTRLHYAFLRPQEDGSVSAGFPDSEAEDFEALRAYRSRNSGLRLLLSVGGWEWSRWFSEIAASSSKRRLFVKSVVDYLERSEFDGIDLDWEYPTGGGHEHNSRHQEDPRNFLVLVEELREAFVSAGREETLLTAALGAQPEGTAKLDLPALAKVLDGIHVMTYDFYGEWDRHWGHHSALRTTSGSPRSAEGAIDAFVRGGFPRAKLNLGIPFYGRAWRSKAAEPLPGSAAEGDGERAGLTWDQVSEILAENPSGLRFDEEAEAAWYYADGLILSFDNENTIGRKCAWLREQGLGGALVWALHGDRKFSLASALAAGLTESETR